MRTRRVWIAALGLFLVVLRPTEAAAQAPSAGPLLLRLPASPRPAALGNAWVAGRDADVLFYNPAQLVNARSAFELSFTRIGRAATQSSIASTYASGKWSLTFGWGVQFLRFDTDPAAPYPYSPDVLLSGGSVDGLGALFAVGGAFAFKGFRIGAAGKYAFDSVPASPASSVTSPRAHVLLADLGVARNLWRGVAAASLQNLGGADENDPSASVPKQWLAGWSITRPAGPLDLGVFTQVMRRDGWTAPGAGLEVGYSWIEGYDVVIRAGARRPDTPAEKPMTFGAAFTADRLTIDYTLRVFDGGKTANGVTIRWR
jgi:hypothetical protein